MRPVLLINFKTYEQGTGKRALSIAKSAERIAKRKGVKIALSVQPTDLERVSKAVSLPVYAQHIDPITPGSHTGWILPDAVKEAGACGTLINHSEHNIELGKVAENVKICREHGLISVCCAATPAKAKKIAAFAPNYIAIEPPELIGGDVSVSKAKPGIISGTVKVVKSVNKKIAVLCGAGVNSQEDVSKALQLGAEGVLVASAIVKSGNPGKVILDLVSGF
ncbi:MAG: triose-phosphate isomerase [Candidatus Aenigmatarchaeota archaeon]|nr:MAG: triose-phosphate isomerase [Candidatus Aenigmarchaeota archaeon]